MSYDRRTAAAKTADSETSKVLEREEASIKNVGDIFQRALDALGDEKRSFESLKTEGKDAGFYAKNWKLQITKIIADLGAIKEESVSHLKSEFKSDVRDEQQTVREPD